MSLSLQKHSMHVDKYMEKYVCRYTKCITSQKRNLNLGLVPFRPYRNNAYKTMASDFWETEEEVKTVRLVRPDVGPIFMSGATGRLHYTGPVGGSCLFVVCKSCYIYFTTFEK